MKRIKLTTDGSCLGNPGPGGWACILEYRGRERELTGAEPGTTNNRMELRAAIEGLKALKEHCDVEVVTDSQYVKNGITSWVPQWRRQDWHTSNHKPVKNKDLWQELDALCKRQTVTWTWVKGHASHSGNLRVDELARLAAERGAVEKAA